jgi:hypothetical protein
MTLIVDKDTPKTSTIPTRDELDAWAFVHDGPRSFLGRIASQDEMSGAITLEPGYDLLPNVGMGRDQGGQVQVGFQRVAVPHGGLPSLLRITVERPTSVVRLDQASRADRDAVLDLVRHAENVRQGLVAAQAGIVIPTPQIRPVNGAGR